MNIIQNTRMKHFHNYIKDDEEFIVTKHKSIEMYVLYIVYVYIIEKRKTK